MFYEFRDDFDKFTFNGNNSAQFIQIATSVLTRVPLDQFQQKFDGLNQWLRARATYYGLHFDNFNLLSKNQKRDSSTEASVMLDTATQNALRHFFLSGLKTIRSEFATVTDDETRLQIDLKVVDLMTQLLEMRGKEFVGKMAKHLSQFLQEEIENYNGDLQWLAEVSQPIMDNYVENLVTMGTDKLDRKYHPEKYEFTKEPNKLLAQLTTLSQGALSLTDKVYYTSVVDLYSASANSYNTDSKLASLATAVSVLGTSIWAATYFAGPVSITLAAGLGTKAAGKALVWTDLPVLTMLGKSLIGTSKQINNVLLAMTNFVFAANYRLHSLTLNAARLPITWLTGVKSRVNVASEGFLQYSNAGIQAISNPLRFYCNHTLRDQTLLAARNGGEKVYLFMQVLNELMILDIDRKNTLPEKLALIDAKLQELLKNDVFTKGEHGREALEKSIAHVQLALRAVNNPKLLILLNTFLKIQDEIENYDQYANNQTGTSLFSREGQAKLSKFYAYLSKVEAALFLPDEDPNSPINFDQTRYSPEEKYDLIRAATTQIMRELKTGKGEASDTCIRLDGMVEQLRKDLGVEHHPGLGSTVVELF